MNREPKPLHPGDVNGSDPEADHVSLSPEEVDELRGSPTREEGYRRSRGKEQAGLDAALSFFDQHGVEPALILDPEENFRHGDFRLPAGTIECKSQPIDPSRYSRNFVEVMEDTTVLARAHHADGFDRTAELLEMTPEALAQVRVRRSGDGWTGPLGRLEYASASLTSVAGSLATIYVNPEGGHLYLYSSQRLLWHLRRAVPNGLYRGMGMSNEDTLAVFVPVPDARWTRQANAWVFAGEGDEEHLLATLHALTHASQTK